MAVYVNQGGTVENNDNGTQHFQFEWKIKDFMLRCTGSTLRPPVVSEFRQEGRHLHCPRRESDWKFTGWKVKLVPSLILTGSRWSVSSNDRRATGLQSLGKRRKVPNSNVNNHYYLKFTLLTAPPRWVTYNITISSKNTAQPQSLVREQSAIVRQYPNQTSLFAASYQTSQQLVAQPDPDQTSPISQSNISAELVSPNQEFGPEFSLISVDEVPDYLSTDGSLTITCKISAMPDCQGEQMTASVPKYDLASKLKCALENEHFSDVTLVAGTKEFKAHKVILSACSQVFATIFQTAGRKRVKFSVDDIEPDVVKEMLTYLYTGEAPNIEHANMATNLLCAAEQYQLDHLKALCEKVLSRMLTVSNVSKMLQLAKCYHADQLSKICLKYISSNWKAFVKTPGWNEIKMDTELAAEILEAISSLDTTTQ